MSDDPLEEWVRLSNKVDNRSASIVQVETGRLVPWLMACSILSGLAVAFSCFAYYQLTITEREYRQVQLQLMDQQALLLRDGLVQPNDVVRGPAGNLYYQPSHPKREK